jgi:hypothetical protein
LIFYQVFKRRTINNKNEPDEIATSHRSLLAMTDLVDEIFTLKGTRRIIGKRRRGGEGEMEREGEKKKRTTLRMTDFFVIA